MILSFNTFQIKYSHELYTAVLIWIKIVLARQVKKISIINHLKLSHYLFYGLHFY